MASEGKVLELDENPAKSAGDTDDAKNGSDLEQKSFENSVILLDSSLETNMMSDTDEPTAKAIDLDEGKQPSIDDLEKIAETVPDVLAGTSGIAKSAAVDAQSATESASSENSSKEPGELSAVSSEKCGNANATDAEAVDDSVKESTEGAVSEKQANESKGDDELDFVSEASVNRPTQIDCEKVIELSDSMLDESVILLDTPEKRESTAVAANDTIFDSDDDFLEGIADECISSLVESVISLDSPEKNEQSPVNESQIDSMNTDAESTENINGEPQSEVDADIDTPKKIDSDESVIAVASPSKEADLGMVDDEPVCVDEKSSEIELAIPAEKVASTEGGEIHAEEFLEAEPPGTVDKSGDIESTEKIESTGPPPETPIANTVVTTNAELENSVEESDENLLKDTAVGDSEPPENVENSDKSHASDDDGSIGPEYIISQPEDSIAAESAEAAKPADETIATEIIGEPSDVVVEHVQDTSSLNESPHIEAESQHENDEFGEKVAVEEVNKVHESAAAIIPSESGEMLSEEKMEESMETDDAVSTPTEPAISMDVDENDIDDELPKEDENKMDCDTNEADEGAADEKVSIAPEENAKVSEGIDDGKNEALGDEARPDTTTRADEQNTSAASVEKDEEKSPERAPVIRVKSMAFLCSDALDESVATEKQSTDVQIGENTADESKAGADGETSNTDRSKKKVKTPKNRLLDNVLKSVLGTTELSSAAQTDSDSGANSPLTAPASPAAEVPKEPEVAPTPDVTPPPKIKRKPQPEVKECLNHECSRESDDFFEAPEFVLSHFHITKKARTIYVCDVCFENAIAKFGELCGVLEDKQPLFLENIPQRPEFVEILSSSDEDDDADDSAEKGKTGDANATAANTVFTADTLAMIENELENVIAASLERVNINEQMEWNRQILNQKINRQMAESLTILEDLKQLQRTADRIYQETYKGLNCFTEEISSLDMDTQKPYQMSDATYPPSGPFVHETDLNTAALYYTARKSLISAWTPCRFIEKVEYFGTRGMHKVQLMRPGKNKTNTIRVVSRKLIAYGKAPPNRLEVGTRCIALFKMVGELNSRHATFYPGVIAEPLREYNKWRYLVFFDDGYAQYVVHDDVRVVCEASANVWEDVVEESREFIENYLQQFSKMRPMVQVQRGQRMMTELQGKWINAMVNSVDASLVQMHFEDEKRYEWIYRGSTRLGPLYRQNKQLNKLKNSAKVVHLIDKVDKVVVDTANVSETSSSEAPPIQRTFPAQATRDTPQKQREKREQAEAQEKEKRAVAKKSTSLPPRPTVQHLNNSTIYVDEDNKPKGKVVYYTAKRHLPPRKYTTHECSPSCLFQITHNLSTYSPLSKPLLSGWERQICKAKGKKFVVYKAPCGRRLRNMGELHRYLRLTNCSLNVENFDYDFMIHCLAEYVIDTCIINDPDISKGVENMVVPCVNYYDNTMPPPCVYSAKRIPTEGVNLNLDDSFMCGCDCTDDCLDKTKCQCWQLTIAGAKYGNPYTAAEDIGYEFKRLPEPVPTGIYECNSMCKCKSNCLNRVAQQPLQMKLQVFKTGNRGWGLRCLNDVPKGSFICCYAGNLLTEQVANEAGENLGDEYFAELDYIEVVEGLKEGYEPEVMNDDDKSSEDEFDPDGEQGNKDDSDDEFVAKAYVGERRIKTRYRTRNSIDTQKNEEKKKAEKKRDADDSSDDERQRISFMPSQTPAQDDNTTATKSIRKFFGKNEAVYIMDAKKTGNIGRYFNHSCAPNLFVQNVFVDTHDLRFPWVSFFASSHIRAGTELTWNYNYDVGSVPGKVLYCQCGAENCRGRLL